MIYDCYALNMDGDDAVVCFLGMGVAEFHLVSVRAGVSTTVSLRARGSWAAGRRDQGRARRRICTDLRPADPDPTRTRYTRWR
ncbi:hypothetical protein GCM10022225_85180 [Plantactinospora mayteni]|uniref:Uncharacterized protein n=1 Tax=Plantactinospora mayteni TaxID=566021 RepID=A0ABQ4F4U5_9ACTN|nr:hypothetical protein Pma05_85030 [Plantactinospora mayteni]